MAKNFNTLPEGAHCHITVNGKSCTVDAGDISYDDIQTLAEDCEGPTRPGMSITYRTKRPGDEQREGILSWGKSVRVEDGMIFNAYFTGNA